MSGMYSSSKIVSNLSMKKKQGLDFENYKLTLHFVLMCDSMKIKVTWHWQWGFIIDFLVNTVESRFKQDFGNDQNLS